MPLISQSKKERGYTIANQKIALLYLGNLIDTNSDILTAVRERFPDN